jgi:hypothetical protein
MTEKDKDARNLIKIFLDLCAEYCCEQTSKEELSAWINDCINLSLSLSTRQPRKNFLYNDCRIEYLVDNLLFSVIKSEQNAEGEPTGITYDIAINVQPYFRAYFGVDRIPVLQQAMQLLNEDLREVSEEISDDIDQWSENIEHVFMNVGQHT